MGRPALNPAPAVTEAEPQAPVTAKEAKARALALKREDELTQLRAELINGRDYNADALLEESRIHYNNAAASFMQFGKLMLVIKEHEGGNFWPFLKSKGLTDATDHRFIMKSIQAAAKFCVGVSNEKQQRLAELGKSKMLELVVLDDAELKELADGGTVAGGLNIDDVDRMSCTELRKALRKTTTKLEQAKETHEQMLSDKNNKIDDLDRQVRQIRKLTIDEKADADAELEKDIIENVTAGGQALLVEIQKFHKLANAAYAQIPNESTAERITQTIQWLFQRINEVSIDHGIPVDFAEIVTPEWVNTSNKKANGKK